MVVGSDFTRHEETLKRLLQLGQKLGKTSLRQFAVLHSKDDTVLEDTAIKDPDYRIRAEATKKITNQEILFDIAQDDEHPDVKKVAISKIVDKKKLLILRLTSPYDMQYSIKHQIDNLEPK